MNVSRRLFNGETIEEETLNKSQCYVTTAGYKNSFAYQKLISVLITSIIKPEEAIVLGGTWRIPVMEELLSKSFIAELKMDGTFNESSFEREYESMWSGDSENAFFSSEIFDKHRELLQAEKEYSGRSAKSAYYVIGVDVGRIGCSTEALVFKVTPQPQGSAIKSLVNLYNFAEKDFEYQAIKLKKLFQQYNAQQLVIDANGMGHGLIDFMIKAQVDPETLETLVPFGVSNDDDNLYKQYITPETVKDAMYLIKATAPINTEIYAYVQSQMSSGKLKFLIDEKQAKTKLLNTTVGKNMSISKRTDYLYPYTCTSILKEQMCNLAEEEKGSIGQQNIKLKQVSRKIPKDKFSALCYGLYYIKKQEENKKKRKRWSTKDLMLYN